MQAPRPPGYGPGRPTPLVAKTAPQLFYSKRRRHSFSNAQYRVTNWPEYDAAPGFRLRKPDGVVHRVEAVEGWYALATRERGGQPIYSADRH